MEENKTVQGPKVETESVKDIQINRNLEMKKKNIRVHEMLKRGIFFLWGVKGSEDV